MWTRGWRDRIWSQLGGRRFDLIVVGGGITGAGLLLEATRLGLRAVLLEQRDFAWGTSSRSSKLVHGGLRYLKEGRLLFTRKAIQERGRLMKAGRGLVERVGFLIATHEGERRERLLYGVGLSLYDALAGQWRHRRYGAEDFRMLAPHIAEDGLNGGYSYDEAVTDDARLVLRIIRSAVSRGAVALSYAHAETLLREHGKVVGVRLHDTVSDRTIELRAGVVVNATGAWADRLRAQVGGAARVRPLRGSHLILPTWRLPVAQAVMLPHPSDRRPVYVVPWEGVTLVGTTDLDHDCPLDEEPSIAPQEVRYLMAALHKHFPSLGLSVEDVLATFSGVRPVIGTGKADPSDEPRDHVVWEERGLLTVAGGKLTTFRLTAQDALRALRHRLPCVQPPGLELPDPSGGDACLSVHVDEEVWRRLRGRYGHEAERLLAVAAPGELDAVPGTDTLWAELRWAARAEGVVHLEDLLLRRVRLGLLLPEGGIAQMARIRAICQPELGWDDEHWEEEEAAYLSVWRTRYSLPSLPEQRETQPACGATA